MTFLLCNTNYFVFFPKNDNTNSFIPNFEDTQENIFEDLDFDKIFEENTEENTNNTDELSPNADAEDTQTEETLQDNELGDLDFEDEELDDFDLDFDLSDLDSEENETDNDFVTVFQQMNNERKAEKAPLKMLILGQPGSGKTTLMKWLALQCGQKGAFQSFVPIFISLKDLGGDPNGTFRSKNLKELSCHLLKSKTVDPFFFDFYFETGKLLFLFDGLDEVAKEETRQEVIAWLQDQYLGQNTWITTSRFSGLRPLDGLEFRNEITTYCIQNFDLDDIKIFLKNWCQNIEVAVGGSELSQDKANEQAKHQYEDLMRIIQDGSYEKLRALAINPLLLTIIAIVHRTRAELPRERHKLYYEILNVMLVLSAILGLTEIRYNYWRGGISNSFFF